jgi:O-antigen ligase
MGKIGLLALCVFIFSLVGLVNETTLEWVGLKPYATNIAGPVVAIALLASGHIFRGLKTKVGAFWVVVLLSAAISVPFSVWRSDSLRQFLEFSIKVWPLFFFICAAVLTVAQYERLLYAQILAGGAMTVLVALLGKIYDGRLVFGNGTFSNPNELALRLLLVACTFIYLIYRGSSFVRLLGMIGIGLASILVFKTGSRGAFLAVVAVLLTLFFTIRQNSARVKMAVLVAVLGACAFIAALSNPVAFRRLTDITIADRPVGEEGDVLYAGSSQMAREELLSRSISLTASHPFIGVGMGEFPVAVDNAAKAQGKKSTWNGTHNSYTQWSSECGIPAALCFIAILLTCILRMRKLYRESSLHPEQAKVTAMALSLLAALICLTVDIAFFHVAYTYFAPVLSGMAIALEAAAKRPVTMARA